MNSFREAAIQGTLAWCNQKRAEKNQAPLLTLPRGKRVDPATCPCGSATGLWVSGSGYSYEIIDVAVLTIDYDTREWLPQAVQDFVDLFDHGHLPQFEIND